MHNKKITKHPVISDFFMKELSDDLIKCKICNKDIPIFFQQGHAAICQSEANSSLNQNKTAIGPEDDSLTNENPSIGLIEFSAYEKEQQPNIVLYGLIKELDCLIEQKKTVIGVSSNSNNPPKNYLDDQSQFADIIKDFQELLTITIEVFQNNHVSFYSLLIFISRTLRTCSSMVMRSISS